MQGVAIIVRAAEFAAVKHREQRRKNGDIPYINHPLGVARILTEEAGVVDADVLAAAILHDTVEDTETTPDDLRSEFGESVASIVAEVTDDKSLSKVERKKAQIAHAPHLSREACLVKLADKLNNLRDLAVRPPSSWGEQRVRGYFCWASAVVEAMGAGAGEEGEGLLVALTDLLAGWVPADGGERATMLDRYLAELGG